VNAFFEPLPDSDIDEEGLFEPIEVCECKGDLVSVEIEDGAVYVMCTTCEKLKHESYADFFRAGPMTFKVTVDPCSCNFMLQYSCDCDRYFNGVLVTEGESMNTDIEGATGD
jgi:hypothetical protein